MKKLSTRIILIALAAIILASLAIYLAFSSEGYHQLFSLHHFKLDGPCLVYSVQEKRFLADTTLHIDEYQASKAGDEVRPGTFVIDGYVNVAEFTQSEQDEVFYSDAAYYNETENRPGLFYSITKYENKGDKDQTLKQNTCFPEAALQYDTDKDAAIIRLTYAENREDLRYLVFYGFSDREEALAWLMVLNKTLNPYLKHSVSASMQPAVPEKN